MNFRPSNYCSVPTKPRKEYAPVRVYFKDENGKLGRIDVGKVENYSEAISAVREAINQPKGKSSVLSSIQGGKK